VRASGGDNYLGGQDFLEVLVKDFLDNSKLDKKRLTSNELSRLYFLGERCKKNLSIQDAATLEIEIQGKAFQWEIHRARFEKISDNLIQRMCIPVERALRDASIKPAALDSVVLVGGATKMPLMRSLVSKMFGRLPASHINPEEVVAIGTAIQAGLKARDQALNEVILTDVCPYSLGVNSASQVGEGYVSGVFLPILERNTVVPASKVKRVSTISPRQKGLRIEVFQGESRIVKNNIKLGQFSVDLIPMDDIQEIDIRFTYDINGILEVESTVLATGAKRIEVFENHAIAISKEDIAKRFKELSEIKIHPRDQAENRMLMAKAERMYEELLGPGREYLQVELGRFEQILENQDIREIEAARNNLHELLERIEENY
jgi:molecular chaperone HscC